MMQTDANLKYAVGKAAQDLLKATRKFTSAKKQAKVFVQLIVDGKKYEYSVVTPALEGDIKVTGHEVESDGIKL